MRTPMGCFMLNDCCKVGVAALQMSARTNESVATRLSMRHYSRDWLLRLTPDHAQSVQSLYFYKPDTGEIEAAWLDARRIFARLGTDSRRHTLPHNFGKKTAIRLQLIFTGFAT